MCDPAFIQAFEQFIPSQMPAKPQAVFRQRVAGFVHRDLKPENVLVGADTLSGWGFNRTRVTDFGLAAVLQGQALPKSSDTAGADLRKTQLTHGVVGTPL